MADFVVQSALEWRSDVRRIRTDEALSEDLYPDWLVLSFINYESDGDAAAVNGKHVGLLQIAPLNAADQNKTVDDFDGRILPVKEAGRASIRHFFRQMQRYKARHRYEPELMAISWKAGAGDTLKFRDALDKHGRESAEAFLASLGPRWPAYRDEFLALAAQMRGHPVPSAQAGRRTPAGKAAPFGGGRERPSCASVTAQRDQGIDPDTNGQVEAARIAARATGLSLYYAPLAEHLENTPRAEPDGTPRAAEVRASVRKVRVAGYLGSRSDATRRSFTLNLPDSTTSFVKPLDTFDWRDSFGDLERRLHLGIDFETRTVAQVQASQGTSVERGVTGRVPCYAIADGEVIVAGIRKGYGRVIYLDHGAGITTRYAHLSEFKVSGGDTVQKGQIIGITGTSEKKKDGTFDETGVRIPHLHFEMRVNVKVANGGQPDRNLTGNNANIAIDPIPILQNAPFPGQTVARRTPEEKSLEQARIAVGNLLTTSTTDYATIESARAYDQVRAQQRALTVALMDRVEHWDEQARSAPVQQATLEKDVTLPSSAFNKFGAANTG